MAEIRIGLVTDNHCRENMMGRLADALKAQNPDAVVFMGDIPPLENPPKDWTAEKIRNWQTIATYKTFERLNTIGVPVFVIPGNHDDYRLYEGVFIDLEEKDENGEPGLDNIIDAAYLGIYGFSKNGNSLDLVFVPGAENQSSFLINEKCSTGAYRVLPDGRVESLYAKNLGKLLKGEQASFDAEDGDHLVYITNPNDLKGIVTAPEKTVVFSHQPPMIGGDDSIDCSIGVMAKQQVLGPNGPEYSDAFLVGPMAQQILMEKKAKPVIGHAGSGLLAKVFKELGIKKGFSGHIHEAAGIVDMQGRPIKEGEYAKELFGNPGPAFEGDYGIATFRQDGTAAMQRFNVDGPVRNYRQELTGKLPKSSLIVIPNY